MKRSLPFPLAALLAAAFSLAAVLPAAAQAAEAARVVAAADVFRALVAVPEHKVPEELMRGAAAVAIFPNVRRVGFVIGGQRGQGVLLVRDDKGSWSRPVFLTLNGASIGWQVGLQSADLVLFFHTRDTVERVLRGATTLGVDASLAAGSLGRSAAAVTDTDLAAEIYSYARTRGIFAGVALQGSVLDVESSALDAYYRARRVRAEDVLAGAGLPVPAEAAALIRELGDYGKSIN